MAITPTPVIIHLDDRIFFFLSSFLFSSSFILSSLRLFLVYSNDLHLFFLSLIFVYFLLSLDLFADLCNLCSIFFVLFLSLFYSFLLLAAWHVSASRIDASSLELFFFPAQLNSMPLILFKLQSSPPPPFLLSMEYL